MKVYGVVLKIYRADNGVLFAMVLINESDKYRTSLSIFSEDKRPVLYLIQSSHLPLKHKEHKNIGFDDSGKSAT